MQTHRGSGENLPGVNAGGKRGGASRRERAVPSLMESQGWVTTWNVWASFEEKHPGGQILIGFP